MINKKENLMIQGLRVIGWVNLLPIIYLGWCAVVGLPVTDLQWGGSIVTGSIGLLLLLVLYTPIEER